MKKLFNLKRLLKMRNSSGFTLVEVILSCALLSILVLGIMTFVTPVLRMMTLGEKNARATMLAETIDTYVTGVLRTARKVEIFENVDLDTAFSGGNSLFAYGPSDGGLNSIQEFMAIDGNDLKYEVRCLGFVMDNVGSDESEYGVRVVNFKKVDPTTLQLDTTKQTDAFGKIMYEGLYPIIKFDTFLAQNQSTGDAIVGSNANGYRISTKVYSDLKCYSRATQAERDNSRLAFEGITFFEMVNYFKADDSGTSLVSIPASDIIKVSEVQPAMDAQADTVLYYYPATLIYYVVAID